MACRLVNCSKQSLRIDLRGGATLQLAPGTTSPALPEELLYDNMFLPKWERDGLIVRVPAKFAEVGAAKAAATPAAAGKGKAAGTPEKSGRKSKGKHAD